MTVPVAERGRAVTVLAASGLALGLAVALVVLVWTMKDQVPGLLALAQSAAQDGVKCAAQLWTSLEGFLARAMYR